MNFLSLDELRMWKSAILLFVFVSLGKFVKHDEIRPHRPVHRIAVCSRRFMYCFCTPHTKSLGLLKIYSAGSLLLTIKTRSMKRKTRTALEKSSKSAQKSRLRDGFLTRILNECVRFVFPARLRRKIKKNYHIS